MLERSRYIVKKALKLGAEDVVATTINSKDMQMRFSNNEIDIAKQWREHYAEIFLSLNKKVVSTEIRNFEKTDEIIERLVKFAKKSKENPEYRGIAQGPFSYEKRKVDKKLLELENPQEYAMRAIQAALEKGCKSTAGMLYLKNQKTSLATSNDVEAEDENAAIELSIRAFYEDDASGYSVSCATNLEDFKPDKAGEEASEYARLAQNPKQTEEGKYDLILSPLFFGSVLSYSIEMTSAFNVLAGLSMYIQKVSEKVASDIVNIQDDGNYEALNRSKFDAEGVPRKKTHIIEDGVLKTYLHNTSTAEKFKTQTTANAGLVQPSPTNILMKEGDFLREELFSEVRNGLFLTNTWYTRFQNFQKGDFSTIPRDAILKIEKGEITGSLKNIRVSDNMLRLYKNIEALSKEREQVHWWLETSYPCITPYVLVRKIKVTKSTE
ncbi:MAG: TldD/PmbA family protein [Candidatus Methanofastidiosia archaeon]